MAIPFPSPEATKLLRELGERAVSNYHKRRPSAVEEILIGALAISTQWTWSRLGRSWSHGRRSFR